MKKLALDAGHGYNTPGKRTPDGIREWSINNAVCQEIQSILNGYEGIKVIRLDDTTGKTDVPLITRTNKALKENADLLISVHQNAFTGNWGTANGIEVFAHPLAPSLDKNLAKKAVDKMCAKTGLRNRGAKTKDLHMVREAKHIPAILTEGGFMDNKGDYAVITSKNGQRKQAEAIAEVVIEYFGLKKKSTSSVSVSTSGTPSTFKVGTYNKNVKIINCTTLNVRSGRGTEHSIICSLKGGTIINVMYILNDNRDGKGNEDLWGSVTVKDSSGKNVTGYIHMGYCQKV